MLHPKTGTVLFLSCLSTDESGFYCNTRKRYAYSKVKTVRDKVKKSKKLAGSSYTDESFRAWIIAPKKRSEKVNLLLSISLNPDMPVVKYEIQEKTYDKKAFTKYIANWKVY